MPEEKVVETVQSAQAKFYKAKDVHLLLQKAHAEAQAIVADLARKTTEAARALAEAEQLYDTMMKA